MKKLIIAFCVVAGVSSIVAMEKSIPSREEVKEEGVIREPSQIRLLDYTSTPAISFEATDGTITIEDIRGGVGTYDSDSSKIRLLGYTSTPATSFEATDGSITIDADQIDGGTPGSDPAYTYSIGGDFINVGETFENLGQGSYTVTIADPRGYKEVVGEVTVSYKSSK